MEDMDLDVDDKDGIEWIKEYKEADVIQVGLAA